MANDEALHLGILMPIWALRMVLLVILILMYAVAGALVIVDAQASYLHYFGLDGYSDSAALAVLMSMLALTVLTLLIDVTAAVLYCCHKLHLKLFLIFSLVQSALFTGVFALTAVGYQHSNSGGILALATIPWLLFIGHAIYAPIMMWRERKQDALERGEYEKTASPVFADGRLPSTFSKSSAHPVPESQRTSQEAYV